MNDDFRLERGRGVGQRPLALRTDVLRGQDERRVVASQRQLRLPERRERVSDLYLRGLGRIDARDMDRP